jgi:hypothetical protein
MQRAVVLVVSMLASSFAYAIPPQPLPTLDEGGLVALVALVGVLGSTVARRRRK